MVTSLQTLFQFIYLHLTPCTEFSLSSSIKLYKLLQWINIFLLSILVSNFKSKRNCFENLYQKFQYLNKKLQHWHFLYIHGKLCSWRYIICLLSETGIPKEALLYFEMIFELFLYLFHSAIYCERMLSVSIQEVFVPTKEFNIFQA